MNIGKYFWRYSSLADLPQVLYVSPNLMQQTLFYFKLKFLVERLKKMHALARYFIKVNMCPSFA